MKYVKLASVVLIGGFVLLYGIGYFLPEWYIASRTIRLNQPPDAVWKVLTDYPAMSKWRKGLASVERVEERVGGESKVIWREHLKNGYDMSLEDLRVDPPKQLVRRVADTETPYGGTWKFDLEPVDGGSTVKLTESGYLKTPIFRLLSRLGDVSGAVDEYLEALAGRFGEKANFIEKPPVRYVDDE